MPANHTHQSCKIFSVLSILSLSLALFACRPAIPKQTPGMTAEPTMAETAPTALPTPTATAQPPSVIFYSPPEADASLADAVRAEIDRLAGDVGYRIQTRTSISPGELSGDIKAVVALAPASNISELVKSSPEIQFVTIGISGLAQAPNLSVIDSGDDRQDQKGFMAGVISAIITPEWRVGAVSLADQPQAKSSLQGFLNGVVFFCGLCRQTYPPYNKYPLYVEVSTGANTAEWQNAADYLIHQEVKTVFLGPGTQNETLLTALDQAGVNFIGAEP